MFRPKLLVAVLTAFALMMHPTAGVDEDEVWASHTYVARPLPRRSGKKAPYGRLVAYIRRSKKDDKSVPSLARQRAKAAEWARINNGGRLDRVYCDNDSGTRQDNRRQYQQMLQDIDQFDTMLVLYFDRSHRNVLNGLLEERLLRKHGKQIIAADTGPIEDSPTGRFNFHVTLARNQWYAEEAAKRVKEDYHLRFDNSTRHAGSKIPPGFRKAPDGSLEPDPKFRRLILGALRAFLRRARYPVICRMLYDGGLRPWSARFLKGDSRRREQFTADDWVDYVTNPRLAGYRVTRTLPVQPHAGLVDLRTYWLLEKEVNRRAADRRGGRRTMGKKRSWRNEKLRVYLREGGRTQPPYRRANRSDGTRKPSRPRKRGRRPSHGDST